MTERAEEWVECQIGYWHARLHGEFTAVYRGEAPWNNAGSSRRFRWIGGGGEPPRTRTAEARLEEFCRELEQAGWERDREDVPDPWYELSFRRFVGLADDPDGAQPRDELTPDGAPLLTLVSVEETGELGTPAADQELENALQPIPVNPIPVDPAPVDPIPIDPIPIDPEPVDPEPVDPEPVDPELVDPELLDPTPVDAEPRAAPAPVLAAAEDIVASPDLDPDPSPTVAEPAEAEEDLVGQPWYQAPAAAAKTQAEPVESELCARIDAYLAATR